MMNATGLLSKTKTKTRECKILLMVSVVLHDNRELLFVQKIDSYLINRHSERLTTHTRVSGDLLKIKCED